MRSSGSRNIYGTANEIFMVAGRVITFSERYFSVSHHPLLYYILYYLCGSGGLSSGVQQPHWFFLLNEL